jgi:hypothetical protein
MPPGPWSDIAPKDNIIQAQTGFSLTEDRAVYLMWLNL